MRYYTEFTVGWNTPVLKQKSSLGRFPNFFSEALNNCLEQKSRQETTHAQMLGLKSEVYHFSHVIHYNVP